jgi:hypothetical protein
MTPMIVLTLLARRLCWPDGLLLGGGSRIYDFYLNNPPGKSVTGYLNADQETGWWKNSGHSHVYNIELVSDLVRALCLLEPCDKRAD